MALLVVCRTCSQRFEPSKADIYAGNWQRCPQCRNKRRWGHPQQSQETNATKSAAEENERTDQ